MNLIEIGSRIKAQRKSMSISQEKLAEMIFVSPHYIYEIERGIKAMSLETLVNMSLAIKVSTDYILFGDNSENRKNVLMKNVSDIFSDCSDDEIFLMIAVAESAKKVVRQYSYRNKLDK